MNELQVTRSPPVPTNLKWYEYQQNNSGGSFHRDANVAEVVYIEATDVTSANRKAEEIGIYFDGHGDCECCGNRWYEAYGYGDNDGSMEMPVMLYDINKFYEREPDKVSSDILEIAMNHSLAGGNILQKSIRIHYANGEVVRLDQTINK